MVSCGRMGRGGVDVAGGNGVFVGAEEEEATAGMTVDVIVTGVGEVEAGVHPLKRMVRMRISWKIRICFFI